MKRMGPVMRRRRLKSRAIASGSISLLLILTLVVLWQNCSDVRLSQEGILSSFRGRGAPLDIQPPTDYKIFRRVVILLDNSNTMVSGPCPYDIDNSPYAPMYTKEPHVPYDPNKGTGDRRDGRALAWDCQVSTFVPQFNGAEKDASKSIIPFLTTPPANYLTYQGIDPEGDRFKIAGKWLDQLEGNLTDQAKGRVKVLIAPVTGGKRQTEMLDRVDQMDGANIKLKFLPLTDPSVRPNLKNLSNDHDRDLAQVMLPNLFRWNETRLGTTAPGDILENLYLTVREDMEGLIPLKALPFARYEIFYLSDGRVRPQLQNFYDALNLLPECRSSCGGNLNKCPIKGVCADLIDSMRRNWGDPEANTQDALELKWSMIDGMPKYYGGGLLKINLVRLKPSKVSQIKGPDETTSFEDLNRRFTKRGLKVKLLDAPDDNPPVALANPSDEIKVFKLTHFYMYNANARLSKSGEIKLDSDGDGLFDDEEINVFHTDPFKQRTNGACLDIIAVNPAYKSLCDKFATDRSCGFTFDADHDDLNECDERALGTDDRDFDTDGDTIPDSLEMIYGFSPLSADTTKDTNGDGFPNLINFAAGTPPQTDIRNAPNDLQMRYRVDFVGSKTVPDPDYHEVRIDQYSVWLENAPTLNAPVISYLSQGDMFQLPELRIPSGKRDLYKIRSDLRLLPYTQTPNTNIITALARIIDPREPELVYWRMLRFAVPSKGVGTKVQIDNSAFDLIPVVDYDGGGSH